MIFSFNCYGHENILSLHRNTLEFTRESLLTKNGDCILGVNADFDYDSLLEFLRRNKESRITCDIGAGGIKDSFSFSFNPDFSDRHEIVIRKTDFRSARTLGINADKAAKDIKRELVEKIKDKNMEIRIVFRTE